MIRLIAMDMDGTLLGADTTRIPQDNIDALREAAARGIALALCSGRMPDDAGFFAVDAGLPMHILALNGTCCLDAPLGAIVSNQPMPADVGARVRTVLADAGLLYGMFAGHTLLVNKPEHHVCNPGTFWGSFLTREGGRSVLRFGEDGCEALMAQGVNKFVAIDQRPSPDLSTVRAALSAAVPEVEITSSWRDNLEINARGINKGSAVAALAARLGLGMDEVMTIGDNDNDVPMLACAGCGVAMANSTPGALAAADWVTTDNVSCGVAAAVRLLALGEDVPGVRRRA